MPMCHATVLLHLERPHIRILIIMTIENVLRTGNLKMHAAPFLFFVGPLCPPIGIADTAPIGYMCRFMLSGSICCPGHLSCGAAMPLHQTAIFSLVQWPMLRTRITIKIVTWALELLPAAPFFFVFRPTSPGLDLVPARGLTPYNPWQWYWNRGPGQCCCHHSSLRHRCRNRQCHSGAHGCCHSSL